MLNSTENIMFLRHAHAQSGIDDKSRLLTDLGLLQARNVSTRLSDKHFDLIISSSATRARDTAKIMMSENEVTSPLVEIDQIYLPQVEPDKQRVEDMLASYPSEPFKKYLKNDETGAWKRYVDEALTAIEFAISSNNAKRILIVGHGNIINGIGLLIDQNAKMLEDTHFDYCEGFELKSGKFRRLFLHSGNKS